MVMMLDRYFLLRGWNLGLFDLDESLVVERTEWHPNILGLGMEKVKMLWEEIENLFVFRLREAVGKWGHDSAWG